MIHPVFVALLLGCTLLLAVRAEAAAGYPYQSCFEVASRLHDVPLDVLLAVAAAESAWNPDARSHANAHGIMQIQWPGTARHLGVTRLSELYNPCLNIELGARYLRELLDRSNDDLEWALAAYNYGPTRLDGVTELPSGASRYVATVAGQRDRIRQASAPATASAAADSGLRFDHPARARSYVATMNSRLTSAEFSWAAVAEGGYAVTMRVAPGGLSFADASLLQALGWPAAGGSR
jgi:soluble lytic murein transglycosylase-like protein